MSTRPAISNGIETRAAVVERPRELGFFYVTELPERGIEPDRRNGT